MSLRSSYRSWHGCTDRQTIRDEYYDHIVFTLARHDRWPFPGIGLHSGRTVLRCRPLRTGEDDPKSEQVFWPTSYSAPTYYSNRATVPMLAVEKTFGVRFDYTRADNNYRSLRVRNGYTIRCLQWFFSFFSPQQVDRRVKVLFGKPYGWKNKTRWRPRIVEWSKETRGYFLETIFRVTDSPDVSEFHRWQTVTIYAHPASPCVCLSIPSLIKRLMRIKYSGIISVPSRDR